MCGRACLPRAGLAPCSAAAVEAMRPSCSDGGMGSAADATGERKRGGLKLLLSLLSACCAVPWVVSGGGARQFGGGMGATGGRHPSAKARSSTAVGVLPAFLAVFPTSPARSAPQFARPTTQFGLEARNRGRPGPRAAPRGVGGQQAGPRPCRR